MGYEKNTAFLRWLILVLGLFTGQFAGAQTGVGGREVPRVGLSDELRALYSVGELPVYRPHTLSGQVSTYDTTGGNEDGFNGQYSFVRKNLDGSLVLLDLKGSGVINRIWTPTPTEDTLDFFIDDAAKPVLSIRYKDLFSGKIFPFVHPLCGSELGGNYCYFPILFQRRCLIVARATKMQFHQIQYRLFAKGTPVQSFSGRFSDEEKTALKQIELFWGKEDKTAPEFALVPEEVKVSSSSCTLEPGQAQSLFNMQQGGRITGIELSPASAFEGLTKDIDLRIYWDDESVPAVDCPAADFFGYAFGKRSMRSLLAGSTAGMDYCYIPMPFDRKAKIELVYRKHAGLEPVKVQARIYYTARKRDPEREGRLYTAWRKERPAVGRPHVFLEARGRGHFIGTILQAQGLKPGMTYFFEGDDSTVIDGERLIHGTGSEDYFNGGWYAFMDCWDSKMSLPLHGCLEYSLPYCRTGGYRWYLSDKLSFEKSFYHSIEHGPSGNAVPAEYASLSFYYADGAGQVRTAGAGGSDAGRMAGENGTGVIAVGPGGGGVGLGGIKPEDADRRVYIPDTLMLYPQLLDYTIWEAVSAKPVWAYPTGGESFMFTVSEESKLRISLKDLLPGKYEVFADYEASGEGCAFSVWQRQEQRSAWVSSYASVKKRIAQEYVCEIQVDELVNSITIRFRVGDRKLFFLNRLILVKEK